MEWTGYADDAEVKEYMDSRNDDIEVKPCKTCGHSEEKLMTLEEAQDAINEDAGYWEMQWDDFTEYLTELMNGREYWKDDSKNMGWMHRAGYKVFEAKNGQKLLSAISPNTDCHYTIWKYRNGLKIRIGHHDAPMGENHIIRPITEKQYNAENE